MRRAGGTLAGAVAVRIGSHEACGIMAAAGAPDRLAIGSALVSVASRGAACSRALSTAPEAMARLRTRRTLARRTTLCVAPTECTVGCVVDTEENVTVDGGIGASTTVVWDEAAVGRARSSHARFPAVVPDATCNSEWKRE